MWALPPFEGKRHNDAQFVNKFMNTAQSYGTVEQSKRKTFKSKKSILIRKKKEKQK